MDDSTSIVVNNKEEDRETVHSNSPTPSIESEPVTLRVGDYVFSTTKSTLRKGDTMLSKMFSGKFKLSVDKDGTPFIDRDGTQYYIQ
jgi:hypothetical protein